MLSPFKTLLYTIFFSVSLGITIVSSYVVVQSLNRFQYNQQKANENDMAGMISYLLDNMDMHSRALPNTDEAANLIALRGRQDLMGYRSELIRINSSRAISWQAKLDATMIEAEAFRQKVIALQKTTKDMSPYLAQIEAGKAHYANLLSEQQQEVLAYSKAIIELDRWTIDDAMAQMGHYKKL